MNDLISRQSAIDILNKCYAEIELDMAIKALEPKEIGYTECAMALVKMWMDDTLSDGEYGEIMYRLNEKLKKDQEEGERENGTKV